jgi:hypothetical protein
VRNGAVVLALVVFSSACAARVSTRMLPREDGTVAAISVAREESTAAVAGVKRANEYCEQRAARAVFLGEETKYQGVLTERTSRVARVARNVPFLGDELTSDEDYRVTTRFKCLPPE